MRHLRLFVFDSRVTAAVIRLFSSIESIPLLCFHLGQSWESHFKQRARSKGKDFVKAILPQARTLWQQLHSMFHVKHNLKLRKPAAFSSTEKVPYLVHFNRCPVNTVQNWVQLTEELKVFTTGLVFVWVCRHQAMRDSSLSRLRILPPTV